MPTITISSAPLPVRQRRATVLRLTRWLASQGVDPGHVVVRFEPLPDNCVYVAGMPVEGLAGDRDGMTHAMVTCCISPERDEDFRAALASEVAAALPGSSTMAMLYLEFRPTNRSDVRVGRNGVMSPV
jgi:phenylpyruvate tautomerase PptA (4-oxalocrotonate tautomerase family)